MLRLAGGNAIGDSSRLFFNGGTLELNNSNEVIGSLSGGVPTGGVVLGTGTLTTGADPVLTTYSGTISGTGGLTKIGPLILTLTGTNTYSGPTNVNGGRLQFSGGSALADTSPLIVAANAIAGFLSGTETIASLAGAGDVELNPGSLIVGAAGTSTSFSGVISGTGNLTKIGTGTLALSAPPTYTGTTSVNGGTSRSTAGSTAGGTVTVAAGAFLQARNFVSRPLAGTMLPPLAPSSSAMRVQRPALSVGRSPSEESSRPRRCGPRRPRPDDDARRGRPVEFAQRRPAQSWRGVTVDAPSTPIAGNLTNNGTTNGPTTPGQMLNLTGM